MHKIKHIFQFGSDDAGIDDLARKCLHGEKTATSSLHEYFLAGMKEMSIVGDLAAVLDSSGSEVCTVMIIRVEVVKFKDITEEFARQEGDGSLDNWLEIHVPYYSERLRRIGGELTADTELVCEWFEVAVDSSIPRFETNY